LLEHPEVVQTAIPQAANAWVSPDLPEIEPAKFDPERVAREAPDWMNKMIELHSPTHSPDYWRNLLKMTVQEIITQPNYTIDDLKRVRRPTLVIQGEKDIVNAAYKHAQFIAYNIPDAECWIPKGIGHNVHDELLFGWIDKVFDFLDRRGSNAGDILYRMGCHDYPDKRLTIFDLHVATPPDANAGTFLTGRVLTDQQRLAAIKALPSPADASAVQILMDEHTPWALVTRGVNDLRRGPDIFTERISQSLFGEIVRILEERDGWAYVRVEHDGYLGWIQKGALYRCAQAEAEGYRRDCNGMVCTDQAILYSVGSSGGDIKGRLPFCVAVRVVDRKNDIVLLELPGGDCCWTSASAIMPMSQRPKPDAEGIAQAIKYFLQLRGVPYLWGGRTPSGYDCSGLAQTFMRFLGIDIPRDADQQYYAGSLIEGDIRPGDLLYFGDALEPIPNLGIPEPGFKITHVAISLGENEYIHSNGAAWSISINSFDPQSPLYRSDLHHELVGVRRFIQ
jgi:hypothetical protein